MREHRVSYRYAKALLESAKKVGMADLIYDDFSKIRFTFEMSKELRRLAASPVFQLWRKKKILNEIFEEEKISPLAMQFLLLLIEKRRGDLVLSIIAEYEMQYNLLNNKLPITVESAVELDEKMKSQVVNKVASKTKMTILPEYKINKELKGGILVMIQDWVFDASIKNQLKILRKQLIEGN